MRHEKGKQRPVNEKLIGMSMSLHVNPAGF